MDPELVTNTESSAIGSNKFSLMKCPEREDPKLFGEAGLSSVTLLALMVVLKDHFLVVH